MIIKFSLKLSVTSFLDNSPFYCTRKLRETLKLLSTPQFNRLKTSPSSDLHNSRQASALWPSTTPTLAYYYSITFSVKCSAKVNVSLFSFGVNRLSVFTVYTLSFLRYQFFWNKFHIIVGYKSRLPIISLLRNGLNPEDILPLYGK